MKYLSGNIVVSVELVLESRRRDDSVVVGPSGVGDVRIGASGEESLQVFETDSERTSTREDLRTNESVLVRIVELVTVSELKSSVHEVLVTVDGQVLVVEVLLNDDLLSLSNGEGRKQNRISMMNILGVVFDSFSLHRARSRIEQIGRQQWNSTEFLKVWTDLVTFLTQSSTTGLPLSSR